MEEPEKSGNRFKVAKREVIRDIITDEVSKLFARGIKCVANKDHKGALRASAKIIRLSPSHRGAHRLRAQVYMAQEEWELAVKELTIFIDLSPTNSEHLRTARRDRAKAFVALGRYDEAAEDQAVLKGHAFPDTAKWLTIEVGAEGSRFAGPASEQ